MKWGFIGTGRIAERIMPAFEMVEDAKVVAAYTRSRDKLDAFCDKWHIPGRYDTIEDLVNDPEVEILYLATPHIVHLEHFRKAVCAGKPILCEKPMGMSAAETEEMVSLARRHGVSDGRPVDSVFSHLSVAERVDCFGKNGKGIQCYGGFFVQ